MWAYVFFSCLYPINLYIFEFIFPSKTHILKVKVASILFSCFCLLLSFENSSLFVSTFNLRILKWLLVGTGPFILPLVSDTDRDGLDGSFLMWRNFVIAPACEELYYRILLPKHQNGTILLSLSFSLAHAHPLLFPSNWNKSADIFGQCLVSFLFGIVCNGIKTKMSGFVGGDQINIWIWMALTGIHGIANYCGVPVVHRKYLKIVQIFILITCLILIFI